VAVSQPTLSLAHTAASQAQTTTGGGALTLTQAVAQQAAQVQVGNPPSRPTPAAAPTSTALRQAAVQAAAQAQAAKQALAQRETLVAQAPVTLSPRPVAPSVSAVSAPVQRAAQAAAQAATFGAITAATTPLLSQQVRQVAVSTRAPAAPPPVPKPVRPVVVTRTQAALPGSRLRLVAG